MRKPIPNQEILNEFWVMTLNNCFIDYIEKLVKNYTQNENYDVVDGQDDDFIIPGRLYLKLDGREAYLELSSDMLAAIYQILIIKNQYLEDRLFGGEKIDLREYMFS